MAKTARPVGRDDSRAACESSTQLTQNFCFGMSVDGTQRVIEKHDCRFGCKRPCKRSTLLLTTGKVYPSLTEHCFVSTGEAGDCRLHLCGSRSPFDGFTIL